MAEEEHTAAAEDAAQEPSAAADGVADATAAVQSIVMADPGEQSEGTSHDVAAQDDVAAGSSQNGAAATPADQAIDVVAGEIKQADASINAAEAATGTAAVEQPATNGKVTNDAGSSKAPATHPAPQSDIQESASEDPAKAAPYAFTGMQCVIDKSASPVCALAFGRLDSELLAFGSDDGYVRVASIGLQRASILHEMRDCHTKRVTDLDWSFGNDQLLTTSEDGSVCLSRTDDGNWSMVRKLETSTAAKCCAFHPVNQSLVLVGTGGGTIDVFNTNTGLVMEDCRATLPSSQPEGVAAVAMDISRDTLFVGDSAGYIHVLRCGLSPKGALLPLVPLARNPPAGSRLAALASVNFTAWANSVGGPALLTAGTDDLVCIYKVVADKGKAQLVLCSKHLMPMTARPVRAAWCPTLPSAEPEYVAMGGEDTAVNVYDVSDASKPPVPVVRLQGHCAPVVSVAWSFDERRLASSDVDGTVIVWKRAHAVSEQPDTPY